MILPFTDSLFKTKKHAATGGAMQNNAAASCRNSEKMMNQVADATQLATLGRFSEALKTLSASTHPVGNTLLHAELLERTGKYQQSRALALSLLKARSTSAEDRGVCESILGLVAWEDGNFDSSIVHLQRAASLASQTGQLERSCWSRLRLLVLLCDQSGPEAIVTLLPDLRADILRTGAAHLLAAFHIFIGQTEAKRGLLRSAMRHSQAGQKLLSRDPNLWLEATAENTQTAILVMLASFDSALEHGQKACQLANESGVLSTRIASLGNLGNLFFQWGRFDEAAKHLHEAVSLATVGSEHSNAVRETLAQIYMADGRIAEAVEILDEIECCRPSDDAKRRYVFRHTQMTRTRLLTRQGRWEEATESAEQVIALAEQSGDILLRATAMTGKAELFIHAGRLPDALLILDAVVPELPKQPPSLYAEYEGLLGLALAQQPEALAIAASHVARAERVLQHLHTSPSAEELRRKWENALEKKGLQSSRTPEPNLGMMDPRGALQTIAMMLLHARRPRLIAEQLVQLISGLHCCEVVRIHTRSIDDNKNESTSANQRRTVRTATDGILTVGTEQGQRIGLELQPKADIESRATVNAIALLLSTVHEIERAQTEREERLTLWPIEDVPVMNEHAVVNGKMGALMTTARRVATTNISVLLTGESGTGKEILARAIHTFSDRSEQAFVPFNCAAIPRDMLESQLFGHRRGAFTGADRDNPGVIRAAKGGTLFLDEIGELSIDLQPKLLRFLESGEICPLGETTPFRVNVRIIAATNAKLDQAVKNGRFREDLFYRLDVVRLEIPPLRERRDELPPLVHHFLMQAAIEYRKGQVRIAEHTMERLLLAPWPGNIRQLQNELRRMVALADANAILTPASLSIDVASAAEDAAALPLHGKLSPTLDRVERERLCLEKAA